jgi:transmembrane sensor
MKASEKIEFVAAHWVVRMERGLTAAEQDEFLDWLGADPRHGEALAQQKAGWTRLNLLADWRPMHGVRPNRDLLAPPPAGFGRARSRMITWFAPLAVAAAVALGYFGYHPANHEDVPSVRIASAQIAPIERRTLEDGSIAELNRGAELTVKYSMGERQVQLARGEAYFQVTKDPSRPFTVNAGGVTVRAVGTAFNVQMRAGAVHVLVTEGQVDVRPSASSLANLAPVGAVARVDAGQRCLVFRAESVPLVIAAVTREEIDAALAWQPKLLDFTDRPLAAIIAEFNRRNAPFQITVAEPALADTPLSASLRSDNVEGFLRLLEGGFGIEAERSGNVIALRRPRSR